MLLLQQYTILEMGKCLMSLQDYNMDGDGSQTLL